MDAFPAFFALAGRTVVIAGHGEGAKAKARLFEGSAAHQVHVHGDAAFASETYKGALIAFIADEDEAWCVRAADAARKAGALVNVVDRPALSDFSTPAIVDRGSVVVAVGTAGAAPILASMLRSQLEAHVPAEMGRLAAWLHEVQDEIRRARPELTRRRALLREVIVGPIGEAAMAGDGKTARALLDKAFAETTPPVGRLYLLDGGVEPDFLTQRALRVLGEADAIFAEDGAASNITARARRDAPRLASAEDIAALLAAGERVVWITAGPPASREGAEILPVARP